MVLSDFLSIAKVNEAAPSLSFTTAHIAWNVCMAVQCKE